MVELLKDSVVELSKVVLVELFELVVECKPVMFPKTIKQKICSNSQI